MKNELIDKNNFLIYEIDNQIKVEAILEDENIWLSQEQNSKLFNKAKSTINEHIKHIYLEKIRDIRSSEKVFWRKILDIYATSIDYNPKDKITIDFFKTV